MIRHLCQSLLILLCFLLPLAVSGQTQTGLKLTLDIKPGSVRAMPPGAPNTAAYLSITNHTDRIRQLVGVYSEVSRTAELHETLQTNGNMQMVAHESVQIPPMATVDFAPGGLHIMLLGLKHPLKPGSIVRLTLCFDGDEHITVALPVVDLKEP